MTQQQQQGTLTQGEVGLLYAACGPPHVTLMPHARLNVTDKVLLRANDRARATHADVANDLLRREPASNADGIGAGGHRCGCCRACQLHTLQHMATGMQPSDTNALEVLHDVGADEHACAAEPRFAVHCQRACSAASLSLVGLQVV